ncbi:hypothetical protein AAHA92_04039 [Salvia divinorum]|uniref:Uncharacterized protein n=1 Tax=Salvia divinorum TaxID=28513 RepID=A0ABD1HXY4_SALDI
MFIHLQGDFAGVLREDPTRVQETDARDRAKPRARTRVRGRSFETRLVFPIVRGQLLPAVSGAGSGHRYPRAYRSRPSHVSIHNGVFRSSTTESGSTPSPRKTQSSLTTPITLRY